MELTGKKRYAEHFLELDEDNQGNYHFTKIEIDLNK